jgi:hypothetical protein
VKFRFQINIPQDEIKIQYFLFAVAHTLTNNSALFFKKNPTYKMFSITHCD